MFYYLKWFYWWLLKQINFKYFLAYFSGVCSTVPVPVCYTYLYTGVKQDYFIFPCNDCLNQTGVAWYSEKTWIG